MISGDGPAAAARDRPITVLGVAGSPRTTGATTRLVQAALLGAQAVPGTRTTFVNLAELSIAPCDRCWSCIDAGHCLIEDDMQGLYPLLLEADAIILGSPVYYGSPSAICKAFMERVAGFGVREKPLALKVGGAIAAGGSRNGGQETTAIAIHAWFHGNDMIPIGITAPVTQWGPTSSGARDEEDVEHDVFELKMSGRTMLAKEIAWMYGRKIATVTAIIATGIAESGLTLPDGPYGFAVPDAFPPELYGA
ncbi:MAG: flavodoxin family protein [Chloroflexota bacterium]